MQKIKLHIYSQIIVMLMLSACRSTSNTPYRDNYPPPCSQQWYAEIEREVELTDSQTGEPAAGSEHWQQLLDQKYTISTKSNTQIGDVEWCHQVHQLLIGL